MHSNHQAEGLQKRQQAACAEPGTWPLAADLDARMITVTSGKGGVGKTQITASLAVAASLRGHRVAVIDADLGLASMDLAFGVRPDRDLRDVVAGRCSVRDIVTRGPCDVDLVAACPGRYDMANLSPTERDRLVMALREFARGYDLVFIDTGAGIGCTAVTFAALGAVILVVTPDPTSLRDAYAMAKVLHKRCGVRSIHVLTNQVASEADGFAVYNRVQEIVRRFLDLDLDFLGSVPRDKHVRASVTEGMPYLLRAPDTPAARATTHIARELFDRIEATQAGARS
ncbi:MAG: MinD/ParA family protein [Polyangiales bacterium]